MVRKLNLNQILESKFPGHALKAAHFRLYHDSRARGRAASQANSLSTDSIDSACHLSLKANWEDCSQFGVFGDRYT
jgi:hypothetical protein